jgi:PAS domain-containing protein
MPQHEVEVILTRQLASYLAMPMLIADPGGDLLYFNEPARGILGRPLSDVGTIRRGEWSKLFQPTDDRGAPVPREELPLLIATDHRRPSYRRLWIRGLDGIRREVEGIAFPLVGQSERMLGAVTVFWECGERRARRVPPGRRDAAGRPVEVILMRQLASYLAIPILLIDPEANLLFFNEPAESIFGQRFDEFEPLVLGDWIEMIQTSAEDGSPLKLEERPMVVALQRRHPVYRRMLLRGLDGITRKIEGIAFPLAAPGERMLGAIGIFWPLEQA